MEMMDKLLSGLGRVWNKLPKDIPMLTLQQGSGPYSLATLTSQALIFHPTAYRSDMPIKQSVFLDDYTLSELVTTVNSMGYTATLTAEAVAGGFGSKKASLLMNATNMPMSSQQTLTGFTSNLWQFLYPYARTLENLSSDSDEALKDMYATVTSGRWVDYWATFFNLRRFPNESDISLRKRVFVAVMNMRTNNVALKELVQFVIGGSALITDLGPALFKIDIDAQFIDSVDRVHEVVLANKGGGIDYFINYLSSFMEGYKEYYKDKNKLDFVNSDTSSKAEEVTLGEVNFMLDPTLNATFRLGSTHIGTGYRLLQRRTLDGTYYGSWERSLTETTYTKPTEVRTQFTILTEALFGINLTDVGIDLSTPFEEPSYSERQAINPNAFMIGSSLIGDSTKRLSRQNLFTQESLLMSVVSTQYPTRNRIDEVIQS